MKKANFGVFCDFRIFCVFRLLNKRSIKGHPLHIFQRKHKTTIILVLEDVDGQFEKPLLYFHDTATIHSNYRQVVLSSTLDFLLVFTLDGLPELGSSFKEIFLVAPFEKNPKLIVFSLILKSEFLGLLEDLFR